MAKHSSFKNLVALEACQNFFLISGLSLEVSLNEAESTKLTALADHSARSEEPAPITNLTPPKTDPKTSNSSTGGPKE